MAALWGGTEAMMIRTELLTPQADVWTAATYNGLFTTHGVTMLFFFVTPVFFGISNYFLPLLLGADDMAFPRINAIGFWLLPPSLLVARAGLPADASGRYFPQSEYTSKSWKCSNLPRPVGRSTHHYQYRHRTRRSICSC